MIKKISSLLICAALIFGFCACGSNSSSEETTTAETKTAETTACTANPVHDCTSADELEKAAGIPLDAPKGAEDVSYSYIEASGDDAVIEQVDFTLDGNKYTYRAQSNDVTDIMTTVEGKKIDSSGLQAAMSDCTNVGAALAGVYNDWETCSKTTVSNRDAVVGYNDGAEGVIAWLDVVPGIMYSLSVDNNASQKLLEDTAADIFVETQGDVG